MAFVFPSAERRGKGGATAYGLQTDDAPLTGQAQAAGYIFGRRVPPREVLHYGTRAPPAMGLP